MHKESKSPSIAKNVSGIKRIPRAIACSLKGYKVAWLYESGFRQYAFIALLLCPLSFFIAQSTTHWFVLIASLVFLLFSEIINTAIEAVSDATMPEYNELIGRAKDLGSAGVFTAVLLVILIWGVSIFEFVYF
ncbi:diacylglycerol kinase [Glaciecola sp. MF2-115]|uniref:diacylglycerol kinase n=1 Tax=Glaciecola sp. MF2-115 TaxID=3384827 RepID=UPI0039A39A6C